MNEPKNRPSLLDELTAVENFLNAAQGILKDGYMPDITALEPRIAMLCKTIQASPQDLHEQCVPGLTRILEKLNDCETGMHAFHEARTKGKL